MTKPDTTLADEILGNLAQEVRLAAFLYLSLSLSAHGQAAEGRSGNAATSAGMMSMRQAPRKR
jgi:hypothetical protein